MMTFKLLIKWLFKDNNKKMFTKLLCLFCFKPMHDNYDLRQEQMNKSSLLSSRKFLGTLLEIFTTHVVSKQSPSTLEEGKLAYCIQLYLYICAEFP